MHINFTAIFTDYHLAKSCDVFDYNNMHSFQGYEVPSSSLLKNFIRSNNILPVGSVIISSMPTECGYNIEEDKANQIKGNGSPTAQALNLPMMLAKYFRHGFIKRAYFFALHNADGYGLLESDQQTKCPAYHAIKSLIAEFKDAIWNTQTHTILRLMSIWGFLLIWFCVVTEHQRHLFSCLTLNIMSQR